MAVRPKEIAERPTQMAEARERRRQHARETINSIAQCGCMLADLYQTNVLPFFLLLFFLFFGKRLIAAWNIAFVTVDYTHHAQRAHRHTQHTTHTPLKTLSSIDQSV